MTIRLFDGIEIKLKRDEFLLFNYYDGIVSILHPNKSEILKQIDLDKIVNIYQ